MKKIVKLTDIEFNKFKQTNTLDISTFLKCTDAEINDKYLNIPLYKIVLESTNEEILCKISKITDKIEFKPVELSINDFDTFVFDMDGTLLDKTKNIVPANLKMLQKLAKDGKNICIATGRAIFMLDKYLDKIPYNKPFLCANGSMIYDHNTFKMISNFNIEKSDAYALMEKLETLGLGYYVFWSDGLVAFNVENSVDFKTRNYYEMMPAGKFVLNPERSFLDDKEICKILVTFDPHQVESLNEFAEYVKKFPRLQGVQTQKNFYDVGEPASKALALCSIADKYNIDLNKTVAFGDANNDAPTFDVVALSCAPLNSMSNAIDGATYVSSKTSDEDWIATFIEQHLYN